MNPLTVEEFTEPFLAIYKGGIVCSEHQRKPSNRKLQGVVNLCFTVVQTRKKAKR